MYQRRRTAPRGYRASAYRRFPRASRSMFSTIRPRRRRYISRAYRAAGRAASGTYGVTLAPFLKAGAGALGAAVAGPVGRALTSGFIDSGLANKAYGKAKDLFSKFVGSGAYTVVSNSLVKGANDLSSQVPMMHGRGATRIRHREYITDINTSTDFQLQFSAPINAAQAVIFPWLAKSAVNWEQWKALGIVFEYVSTSSNALNSINTALGSINMATQYNVLDNPFTNKQQLLNYEFSVSTKPADSVCHPVECDPSETPNLPLYTTGFEPPLSGDARLYNLGRFSAYSSGSQAASVAGELWVTYDILLIKPKLPDNAEESFNTNNCIIYL